MNEPAYPHDLAIPREASALVVLRAEAVRDTEIERFTCDECPRAPVCPFVFDAYNTDGDCLDET